MKKGQLFILLILCVIVGSAGWLIMKNKQHSWDEQETGIGELLFPDLPLNDITKLSITSKEKTVELIKGVDIWTVKTAHGYYADFSKIAGILKNMADLKVLQKIEIGKDDHGRLELNEPDKDVDTGTRIEFFDKKNSSLGRLLLGKEHMRKSEGSAGQFGGGGEWPDGRYVFQPKANIVALVSEPFSNITDDPNDWLDKSFIKVEKIKKATVKKGENVIWTVSREDEGGALNLEDGIGEDEQIVKSKLSGIDSAFQYANFNSVADPVIPEETHGFSEGRRYVAETFEGFTYTIDIGKKAEEGDEYPIKISIDYKEPAPPVPSEEGPEEGEKEETEEEKAKKQEEFKKKEEEFKNKVAENKKTFEKDSKRYSNWVFMVASNTVGELLADRQELFEKKEKDEKSKGEAEADEPSGITTEKSSSEIGLPAAGTGTKESIDVDIPTAGAVPKDAKEAVNTPDGSHTSSSKSEGAVGNKEKGKEVDSSPTEVEKDQPEKAE